MHTTPTKKNFHDTVRLLSPKAQQNKVNFNSVKYIAP